MSDIEKAEKLLNQRKTGAERAAKHRAKMIATDPDFLKKKAEYAKKQRSKFMATPEIIAVVNDIKKVENDKQIKKGNKIPKEYVKPSAPKILKETIEPKKQQELIQNKMHYDEKGVLLLNMTYFKDIDYSPVPIPLWKKTNNKALTVNVIKDHLQKINIIYKEYFKIGYDDEVNNILIKVLKGDNLEAKDLLYLKYNDDFFASSEFKKHIEFFAIKFIESPRTIRPSLNTFISYLKPIVNVLSRIETAEIYKNYITASNILKHLSNVSVSFKKENIMKTDDNDNKKTIDYGNKENLKESIDKSALTVEEKALSALYLFLPPRRLEDYRNMIYKNTYDPAFMCRKEHNYLNNHDGISSIVFNKHKTDKTYKDQMYNITENNDLNKYLKPHTDTLKDGDYLFKIKKGNRPIDQANFSKKAKRIFTKIFKINLTVDDIRSSAESWNINTPGRTMNEQEAFSLKMGHSLVMGLSYVKI